MMISTKLSLLFIGIASSINAQQVVDKSLPLDAVHVASSAVDLKNTSTMKQSSTGNAEFAVLAHSLLIGATSDAEESSFYDLSVITEHEYLIAILHFFSTNDNPTQTLNTNDTIQKTNLMNTINTLKENSNDIDWERIHSEYNTISQHLESKSTTQQSSSTYTPDQSHRNLRAAIDGDLFHGYEYSKGRCPRKGSIGVPCAPNNLDRICNKYSLVGSFQRCIDACAPALCCIHSANPRKNDVAPNCNRDEHCGGYNYCYIAWWKLHDTVGPASFLRLEQDDDFYDVKDDKYDANNIDDDFQGQLFYHHFNDIEPIIEEGSLNNGKLVSSEVFGNENYWYGDDRIPTTNKYLEQFSATNNNDMLEKSSTDESTSAASASTSLVDATTDDEVEKELTETQKLLQKVKQAGTAGAISYALWELAFWGVSLPVCVVGYKQLTGHWPDFSNSEDMQKVGAEAFAFVNFARLAVPLRIGLALSTTQWIDENVVQKFMKKGDDVESASV
ncbi:predicted protein [Thalassiosira pseudonana CCMP1335]|uniref:Uncharacterized protein n=1 Tax=Thalassiosira pseudonana TaxID=35128 RepID=B8C238_THAPS|nr:predicted protein [Thalassiosira pseudonana CCMP1335]EED91874.1 predicted protein [Thalassiosira pseudonana CCMP1335]